jgi:hypothetical protein
VSPVHTHRLPLTVLPMVRGTMWAMLLTLLLVGAGATARLGIGIGPIVAITDIKVSSLLPADPATFSRIDVAPTRFSLAIDPQRNASDMDVDIALRNRAGQDKVAHLDLSLPRGATAEVTTSSGPVNYRRVDGNTWEVALHANANATLRLRVAMPPGMLTGIQRIGAVIKTNPAI